MVKLDKKTQKRIRKIRAERKENLEKMIVAYNKLVLGHEVRKEVNNG